MATKTNSETNGEAEDGGLKPRRYTETNTQTKSGRWSYEGRLAMKPSLEGGVCATR